MFAIIIENITRVFYLSRSTAANKAMLVPS